MNAILNLACNLTRVKGIGSSTYLKFAKKGIISVLDLIQYFPTRHENYSIQAKVATLQAGDRVSIEGKVVDFKNIITRKSGFAIQKATLVDSTGKISLLWFNQPFMRNNLSLGQVYSVAGNCERFQNKLIFKVTELEPENNQLIHTARLVPYYSEIKGVSSKFVRHKIFNILNTLTEVSCPDSIVPLIKLLNLPTSLEAIKSLHFPKTINKLNLAKERVVCERLLDIHLVYQKQQARTNKYRAYALKESPIALGIFKKSLPYQLTKDQSTCLAQFANDLKQERPMNRLLLGDVGSGKTTVIAYALYLCFLNKKKAVLLVPTDTLANQHYQTLKLLFKKIEIKIGLMSAGAKLSLKAKNYDLFVSTHAILYQKSLIPNLALVIVDEQHKFGVKQRAQLTEQYKKSQFLPHMCTVSATPIPRSLALTLYGGMNVSLISEMPKNRKPVKTYLLPEAKRQPAYNWIKKQVLTKKLQVYVVCPFIDPSESDKLKDVKSVNEEIEKLEKIFPKLVIKGIHSRLKERNQVVTSFKKGKVDILVATSMIEVGVDIPNANIMLIEGADRFGLAQLHQLRGRIGRGNTQAYCFLLSTNPDTLTSTRLSYMEKVNSGFKLAELDLKLRGPGNILGLKQHGFGNVSLKDLLDTSKLTKIRTLAKDLLANNPNFSYTSLFYKPGIENKQIILN